MKTQESIRLTQEAITQALFQIMEKKDYEKISMTEIAEKAGVSRATLYRYYVTKPDIIKSYFQHHMESFSRIFQHRPHGQDDYYEQVFTAFQYLKQEQNVFKCLIKAGLEQYYLDFLNEKLAKDLAVHFNLKGITAYHIAGSLYNVSLQWVKSGCQESVRKIADEYFSLLFPKR